MALLMLLFSICVFVFVVSLERLSLLIVYILKDKTGKDNQNLLALQLGVTADPRAEALVFIDQTIEVMAEGGDDGVVLPLQVHRRVVVDVADEGQRVFEVCFIFHRLIMAFILGKINFKRSRDLR